MAGGRPSKFKPEFVEQAEKLCILGATEVEVADFFHVSVPTIRKWAADNVTFLTALKGGKEAFDARIEQALAHRALGYSYEAVKPMSVTLGGGRGSEIQMVKYREHVPPDTTAMIFWLKNRKPAEWRDRVDHTIGPSDAVAEFFEAIAGGPRAIKTIE